MDAHSGIEIIKLTLDIKYLERSSIQLHASSIRTRPFTLAFLLKLFSMAPRSFLLASVASACLFGLSAAEPIPVIPDRVQLQPRGTTCTPQAGGSPSVDDVPAIQSAIKACPSGTIVIPSGKTYHINSQLSFSGCSGCTLQLNGELSVSTDFTYWDAKGQIIHIQNINGATITGSGTINGNGQASCTYCEAFTRPMILFLQGNLKSNLNFRGSHHHKPLL